MKRGDKKELADVVFGTDPGAPRADVAEHLRWFGIALTEEEEERIAHGETVTFLVPAEPQVRQLEKAGGHVWASL